jgi:hypothetical protein
MASVVLNIGTIMIEDQFTGELCVLCEEHIYGKGQRLVFTVQSTYEDLPNFRESKVILCQSCKIVTP